ncbi:TlpA family protein disulfide reductase [Flagellimonas lutimaris]|uniref:TlpA family protein disulfide reductase n=1 Tax=Flagellimonas lutimaris TaxID=475082 RepID=A0A3A1N8D9_9FLAO|nr:TlpA disulfide reductase family protein [Allomuricauda lutimaris]RIV32980.1 TlpA family protein disulfide reductase [Allomuricauda lutimaris]
MKYCLALSLFTVLFFQSCSEEPWLSGKLDMSESEAWKPIVYLVQPQKLNEVAQSFVGLVLDSAKVGANGHFQFDALPEFQEPVLLEIVVQKKGEKYPNRLINENPETDNYFPFVYGEGANMVVNAEVSNFQSSLTIEKPSIANEAMLELRDKRMVAFKNLKSQTKEHEKDEDLLALEKSLHVYQELLINFSNSTSELLPGLMALRWASPEGDYERIAELVHAQSTKWSELYPEHLWVKELVAMADKRNLPILTGDVITNLQFPMKSGGKVSLQTILKDKKLVLLDVWASWCAPCRLENRNILVPLWEKYNSQNFQIVAYGLESSEKAWDNAIEKDGAYRWLHASHLQGDQNPFMEKLRLKTIPANFLLNQEGRVLAKNLHGQDLSHFVNDYMSKQ